MSIFKRCKHEWEIIVNDFEKSLLEKIADEDKPLNIKGQANPAINHVFVGKKIIILQCKKCGKLNKTIEEI